MTFYMEVNAVEDRHSVSSSQSIETAVVVGLVGVDDSPLQKTTEADKALVSPGRVVVHPGCGRTMTSTSNSSSNHQLMDN